MVLASGCCDVGPLFAYGLLDVACGAILLLVDLVIAVRLWRAGVAFWRHRLVLALAVGSVLALTVGLRAIAFTQSISDPYPVPGGVPPISGWEVLTVVTLGGALTLVAIGVIGILMERSP